MNIQGIEKLEEYKIGKDHPIYMVFECMTSIGCTNIEITNIEQKKRRSTNGYSQMYFNQFGFKYPHIHTVQSSIDVKIRAKTMNELEFDFTWCVRKLKIRVKYNVPEFCQRKHNYIDYDRWFLADWFFINHYKNMTNVPVETFEQFPLSEETLRHFTNARVGLIPMIYELIIAVNNKSILRDILNSEVLVNLLDIDKMIERAQQYDDVEATAILLNYKNEHTEYCCDDMVL